MCGICGFNWDDKKLAKAMCRSMSTRGPDDNGTYTDKHMSLGHLRLSIIDLSKKGHQPMSNDDGNIHIVYNGEIYNFKEIRQELEKKGYCFNSNTDTEVILKSHMEWGDSCVERFNGMFAFAIWDASKNKLFLARDRMGIKPLYYFYDGKRFIFASEIKAILEHDIKREVDREGFSSFMNFRFTVGPRTILKDIRKLLPAHTLVLEKGKLKAQRYWEAKENIRKRPISKIASELKGLLKDSVQKRLMSDVALGVYLSGGIDSSSMVAMMRDSVKDIKTFSVGFGEGVDNELAHARRVSDHFSTDHHEIQVDDNDLKDLPKMVWHLDEPIGDAATLPTYIISRFAKKKVTVVLAGEGADEIFAGYDRYKMMLYGHRLSTMTPDIIKRSMLRRLNIKNENIKRLKELVCEETLENKYLKAISLFSHKEQREMGVSDRGVVNDIFTENFRPEMKNLLNRILFFDQKTLLPDDFFMKADKMSMAHSVEERVPFLDHRMVEFSFTIPPRLKMRGVNEKFILKKAMKSSLPGFTVKRKKRGYDTPMDRWLKADLKPVMEQLLENSTHDLYKRYKVDKMLQLFKASRAGYKGSFFASQKLWSMLMFEMWHRMYIDEEKVKI